MDERLRAFATACAADPGLHARGLWAYLEVGDAARARLLALQVPGPGALPVLVAAPTTLVPHPLRPVARSA
ncbi:hypothetical protein C1I98_17695 [Spongiactinospora gelatinilytica]|uniref:Uncharacterized protein n=1 Tax=Spongiactinospora gelatinilytica TaxID=2666298 RepID=A0A2W2GN64_9ACTN|nr:hypothetical protein [Spongiactinospora gelatinilytica]PZG44119.1 hypothetical protein C1I98_17695 [Spongiactinospora gelatinilytica]